MMKVCLSNPISNPNVRAAAYGLWQANMLAEFHVTLAVFPGSLLDRIGDIHFLGEIRRRLYDPVLKPFVKAWPWLEIGRLISPRVGLKSLVRKEKSFFNNNAVNIGFDKHVAACLSSTAKKNAGAVYCFEDSASFSFRKAKTLGLKCLYELPIGYWRNMHKLLDEEKERWPEWAVTITGFNDSSEKLARKDEELKLADKIFVASSFTASTLKDYHGQLAPVKVVPYGFPPVSDEVRQYSNISSANPLKLLFVGSLSQRKGIADLFEAVKTFGNKISLTVVGNKTGECKALDKALAQHRWIPTLPHSEILKLMRKNDVLVFPSLFEGFGLVITEAMSQGTPVITTDRTAGPDIITHGKNGWLVEAGSVIGLKQAIDELLSKPSLIAAAGKEAMLKARQRPWHIYGQELAAAITKIY